MQHFAGSLFRAVATPWEEVATFSSAVQASCFARALRNRAAALPEILPNSVTRFKFSQLQRLPDVNRFPCCWPDSQSLSPDSDSSSAYPTRCRYPIYNREALVPFLCPLETDSGEVTHFREARVSDTILSTSPLVNWRHALKRCIVRICGCPTRKGERGSWPMVWNISLSREFFADEDNVA